MPDEKDKLVPTVGDSNDQLAKPRSRIAIPKLHARMNKAVEQAQARELLASAMSNRLALMLDCSGSMAWTFVDVKGVDRKKIELLRDAIGGFVNSCDFNNTSVSMNTFPAGRQLPLTCDQSLLAASAMGLSAAGGTPMADCLDEVLNSVPLTRGVLVSDGDADCHGSRVIPVADKYATAEIPIDCVHIGDSSGGEETLREIAKRTGGLYIKFTDVSQFANNFKYLTPGFYGYLTSGDKTETAKLLGAKEVL